MQFPSAAGRSPRMVLHHGRSRAPPLLFSRSSSARSHGRRCCCCAQPASDAGVGTAYRSSSPSFPRAFRPKETPPATVADAVAAHNLLRMRVWAQPTALHHPRFRGPSARRKLLRPRSPMRLLRITCFGCGCGHSPFACPKETPPATVAKVDFALYLLRMWVCAQPTA